MTAKDYLKRYEEAERKARRYKREYEEECAKINSINASIGDGTPHGGSISKRTEIQALRLIDKALEWKQAELDAIQVRQEVFEVINTIPGEKGEILYQRYVHLKPWEEVASIVGYSLRNIFILHRKALDDVEHCIELHY